ncbi:hypothetical protein Patl1_36992 [Pistacia atlantica]|nr:hypothetical protein Patl1_36992 [Pistacia atlantica]
MENQFVSRSIRQIILR